MNSKNFYEGEVFGFIATKPLQLMVVLAIIEQIPNGINKELLIIDCFSDAKLVFQKMLPYTNQSLKIKFFPDEKAAYNEAGKKRYKKLFIDSDVGFKKSLTILKLKIISSKTNLAVYEEGIGTYRSDLYRGLKQMMLKFFGCGVFFGGNYFVKEIYLYDPDEYFNKISAKKILINKKINEILVCGKYEFDKIFDVSDIFEKISNISKNKKSCIIYLTDWVIRDFLPFQYNSAKECVLIKPHPHIQKVNISGFLGGVLIPSRIPAELLILFALNYFSSIILYHHGSSVEKYSKHRKVICYKI